MVQHVLPKGFKRIRYYGVQATKTFAKVKAVIHAALAKVEGVGKGAVKIMARLTYRQRYEQSTGRDPFRCPHCGAEMAVWRIWHPKYGVIYDEGEVIKRGTYTSTAQRAGPCRQADIPQVRPEGVMCTSCVVLPSTSAYPCATTPMLRGHVLSVAPETASMQGGASFRLDTGYYHPFPFVTRCYAAAPRGVACR